MISKPAASFVTALALALVSFGATAQSRYPQRDASAPRITNRTIRATFTVAPGQSIQAAADRALPGDRIEILPSVYHETVAIDFDDIEFVGVIIDGERPILDGRGVLNDAVLASGDNFLIADLEIRNYQANGIVVNQAKNVTFRNIVCDNTGKYGVYPVLCDGVLIEDCVVSNVWDAGIYAGQCRNVVVRNSESFFNTIGFEAENSVGVLFHNNTAHDNSLGILIVLLPNLPMKTASDARVINNRVYNNNYPNLAPEGNLVAVVGPGNGISVSSADRTEVTRNIVEGNQSFGIALYSIADYADPDRKIDIEPNPDNNLIHNNRFARNGSGPVSPRFKKMGYIMGADLFWSGRGNGNGWNEDSTSSIPSDLPSPSR